MRGPGKTFTPDATRIRRTMIPEILTCLAKAFRVYRRLAGDEWVREHVYLTTGATRGRWDWQQNPPMQEVQRATTQAGVEQVTVMGSPQTTGKTSLLANTSNERGHQRPLPQLYVSSNQAKATAWAFDELRPRIEACEALKDQLPPPNRARYHWTAKIFKLARYWIRFAGGQTDSDIKSISVALLLLDEVDAWVKYGGNRSKGKSKSAREAPFVTLAKERVASFRASGEALVLVVSTPSTEDGPIYKEYLAGSQESFMPRCPCCGKLFTKRVTIADYDITPGERPIPKHRRDQVRGLADWDLTKLRERASIRCQHSGCKGRIGNADRGLALVSGDWVAANPEEKRHRSFHLSRHTGRAMSSTPVGDVAVAYVQGLYADGGSHHFSNTWEGWPYVHTQIKRDEAEWERLLESSAPYKLAPCIIGKVRQLPTGCNAVGIFAGMDVQAYAIVYVIRAVDNLGRSWLLDPVIIEGCNVLEAAEVLQEIEWVNDDNPEGSGFRIYEAWCDAGYKAYVSGSVYEAHRAMPDFLIPCAGRSRTNHRLVSEITKATQIDSNTQDEVPVMWIDDDLFKRRLYGNLIGRAGAVDHPGFFIPSDIEDIQPRYRPQILSEREGKTADGEMKWGKKGANDFGDAEKYCLAAQWYHREKIAEWMDEANLNRVD